MKTIIEDIVAKMDGKEETVLPEDTTIRFEIGNIHFKCKATNNGLIIHKENTTESVNEIIITAQSSNYFYVR